MPMVTFRRQPEQSHPAQEAIQAGTLAEAVQSVFNRSSGDETDNVAPLRRDQL
jgi:hypothetical protein